MRGATTQRCNLKCVLQSRTGACPQNTELSVRTGSASSMLWCILGVRKIRRTGREPLVRKDLEEVIHGIGSFTQDPGPVHDHNAQHLPGRVEAAQARAGQAAAEHPASTRFSPNDFAPSRAAAASRMLKASIWPLR